MTEQKHLGRALLPAWYPRVQKCRGCVAPERQSGKQWLHGAWEDFRVIRRQGGKEAIAPGRQATQGWLDVEPQQVVLGKTEAADRCFGLQTGMRAMPIVTMQPVA